jgi:hypothetical protein
MVLAGVAAVGAAAAWLGRRHLRLVPPPTESLLSGPSSSPPLEPPPIEPFLVEASAADFEFIGPDSSGPESEPRTERDSELKELWGVEPELSELEEELDAYDAVDPEDLGSVWLSRATQTSAEPHTHLINQISAPEPEDGSILEDATLSKVAKAERRKNAPG